MSVWYKEKKSKKSEGTIVRIGKHLQKKKFPGEIIRQSTAKVRPNVREYTEKVQEQQAERRAAEKVVEANRPPLPPPRPSPVSVSPNIQSRILDFLERRPAVEWYDYELYGAFGVGLGEIQAAIRALGTNANVHISQDGDTWGIQRCR
ncbi:MAG: hypothetical protein WC227_01925 [Patescibacteria group bacterium]|jgi:hypothetical protein